MTTCTRLTGAVLLAGFAMFSGQSSYASQATDLLLMKARSLEGRGLMDLAARSWEQVLLADPNNAEALAGLARVAKMNGKQDEANKYLDRLRSISPQNAEIGHIQTLGSLSAQRAQLEQAQLLARKQDFEGAMRIYRQVFGNEPPPGGWAISFYETEAAAPGGWDDAVAGLRKFIARYPEAPEYPLALGRLLTYHPKSRAQGLEVLESIKGSPAALEQVRSAWRQALLWDAGNPESIPSLRAYLARYPDRELSKLLARNQSPVESAEPKGPIQSPREGQGYQALHRGSLKQAEQDFSDALKTNPRSATALSGLGFVMLKQQDFAAAIPLFEQALAAQPKNKALSDGLATAKFWNRMKQGSEFLKDSRAADAVDAFKEALAVWPQNPEAMRALAGSYMMQKRPALAIPLYRELTLAKGGLPDDWYGLLRAQDAAGHAAVAADTYKQVPDGIKNKWLSDPEHLITLSSIHADADDMQQARKLEEQSTGLLEDSGAKLTNEMRMQYAGLYMRLKEPRRAVALYEQVTEGDPKNLDAWEGLVSALTSNQEYDRANAVIRRMPEDVYKNALTHAGFLRSAATLDMALKNTDTAEHLLQRARLLDSRDGKTPDPGSDLQLAEVLRRSGKTKEAEQLLKTVIDGAPEMTAARLSLLALLHSEKRDQEAFDAMRAMPESVTAKLDSDPAFLTVQSAVYADLGRSEDALRILNTAAKRAETEGRAVPVDLQLQRAWLLLNSNGNQTDLYNILSHYKDTTQLTADQRAQLTSIWSIWVRRRSTAAVDDGDLVKAASILRTAAKLFPQDAAIQGSLAGVYLKAKDPSDAFVVYKQWGLKGATADDFSGAVGAALTAQDTDLAARWLKHGLQKYPNDSRLLSLAGKQAAQQGDYGKAKILLREALATPLDDSRTRGTLDAKQDLGALLLSGANPDEDGTPVTEQHTPSRLEANGSEPSLHEEIKTDLQAIDGRNSPFFMNGTTVQGRSGRGSIDRLIVEEANIEASTTVGDQIRLSLIAKPTYLDSGKPDTPDTPGFGTTAVNGHSSTPTAFGIAAEGQISSRDFGLRLGMAPYGFLVRNWTGGLRFTPGDGPFSIFVTRDVIRDTKLSFAGERDPNTNQVWGGAVANSLSLQGNWGDAKSGFYASAGYQYIDGKGIATNNRIDATTGTYFRVFSNTQGSLTLGLNLSGMHYAKNLRYFTLGQGGYFSPQQYFLANVPFRWTGNWNRKMQYSIGASLGVQHFSEDSSPFFPLMAQNSQFYPSYASTGGNYNVDFRMVYQISPQWLAGAFVNAGNARDYRSASAGIYLKYLFQPRALSPEISTESVPDWRGAQPFGLPGSN